jgi:hypothetical protein
MISETEKAGLVHAVIVPPAWASQSNLRRLPRLRRFPLAAWLGRFEPMAPVPAK